MTGLDILIQRRKLAIKQWELARLLGISPSELSQIETGRKPLSPELEAKIEMIFDELNKKGGKHEHSNPTRQSQF